MRLAYPGGFLTFVTVMVFVGFCCTVYLHWWAASAIITPVLLCHIGVLYQIRPAAQALIVLYALACAILVAGFFIHTSETPKTWRLVWKFILNLITIQELYRWLRRQAHEP